MKAVLALSALAVLAAPVAAQDEPDREAELAGVLESWQPSGPPERCLNVRRANVLRVINRTAIVYRLGGRLYVNRPVGGAEYLDRRDSVVSRRGGYLLCAGEMIELTDPYSGIVRLVTVGSFEPYRR